MAIKPNDNADADGTKVQFTDISKAQEAGHTISITAQGIAYSHCHNSKVCDNELGQLGRGGDPNAVLPIILNLDNDENNDNNHHDDVIVAAQHAYAGGFASSGHSAILDASGELWFAGCDRWQQLGMGSSQGGSSGYTWKGGRLWQERFFKNDYVVDLLKGLDPSLGKTGRGASLSQLAPPLGTVDSSRRWIRDLALGGDHTVVLSSNKKDVVVFGKGGEGQLGLSSKPWVSSPARSKLLSSKSAEISAVCAFRNCSMTLNDRGEVMGRAGKCSMELKGMKKALELCRRRAKETGLNESPD